MENGYEEFVEEFRQLVIATTGYEETRVRFKSAEEKPVTAGDRLFMLCSEKEERQEICGIHISALYDQYQNGKPMECLLKEVLEQIHNIKQSGIIGRAMEVENYEKVKDSLCIRLLNRKKNAWDLGDAVYKTLGDIAMVLYLEIGEANGVLTTMKIRESMMAEWGVSIERAFEVAILNSFRKSPPRFYPWKKWIGNPGYAGESFLDSMKEYHMSKAPAGNCLSTEKKTNGAVAVFYPGVADRIAQLLDDSFYLVFTSVHEVMIHGEEGTDPDMLRQVLKDTVRKTTPEEDFLTYDIYYYDQEKRRFFVVH